MTNAGLRLRVDFGVIVVANLGPHGDSFIQPTLVFIEDNSDVELCFGVGFRVVHTINKRPCGNSLVDVVVLCVDVAEVVLRFSVEFGVVLAVDV